MQSLRARGSFVETLVHNSLSSSPSRARRYVCLPPSPCLFYLRHSCFDPAFFCLTLLLDDSFPCMCVLNRSSIAHLFAPHLNASDRTLQSLVFLVSSDRLVGQKGKRRRHPPPFRSAFLNPLLRLFSCFHSQLNYRDKHTIHAQFLPNPRPPALGGRTGPVTCVSIFDPLHAKPSRSPFSSDA